MDIRSTIVANRRERILREGYALGVSVPDRREAPLNPFPASPGIICEVKRRSPSRGAIDEGVDPLVHIGRYVSGGARSVSILTEEDYFHGSLEDLIEAKRRYPELSILRKDFLLDEADIDISYRAGADAVLLIASVLSKSRLESLHERATGMGMTALVEIHDTNDLEKVSSLRPGCVGCNARNLETFEVDLLAPIALRGIVDWECTAVFESGIWLPEHVAIARGGGFDAILVGESVVRNPEIVPELVAELRRSTPGYEFWGNLVSHRSPSSPARTGARRTLVKVCGITNLDDLRIADDAGADILGFVFAESPRRVTADFVRSLPDTRALKVGVVASRDGAGLDDDVRMLVDSGYLDAVQFHGDENPDVCSSAAVPYYKALRLGTNDRVDDIRRYHSPRVLVDSRVHGVLGGSGTRIDEAIVDAVKSRGPLWLAGGLTPENIGDVVTRFRPELVDVSSGLESSPGRKDPGLVKQFFANLSRAEESE